MSRRHPLACCAKCRFRPVFHRDARGVVLIGRMARLPRGTAWVCAVCIGNMPPGLRRQLFGRRAA